MPFISKHQSVYQSSRVRTKRYAHATLRSIMKNFIDCGECGSHYEKTCACACVRMRVWRRNYDRHKKIKRSFVIWHVCPGKDQKTRKTCEPIYFIPLSRESFSVTRCIFNIRMHGNVYYSRLDKMTVGLCGGNMRRESSLF